MITGSRNRFVLYMLGGMVLACFLAFLRVSGLMDWDVVRIAAGGLLTASALMFLALDTTGFLCLVMAFFPFTEGVFKFEIGVITFSPFTMGIILLTAKGLMLLALGKARYRIGLPDLLIGGLCLFYLISLSKAEAIQESGLLAFHALFIPALAYFCIRLHVADRRTFRLCTTSLFLGIFAFSAAALFQYATTGERIRLLGAHPVSIATMTMLPILAVFFTKARHETGPMLKSLVCLGAFLVTFSRAYYLCLALSPAFMALVRRRKALVLAMTMLILSLAYTLFLTLSVPRELVEDLVATGEFDSVVLESFQGKEQSASRLFDVKHWQATLETRALTWRLGLNAFLDNPVTGTGLRIGKQMVTQHNVHIEWLEFGGVVGYAAYLALFAVFFACMGRRAPDDPFLAVCVLAMFFILVNSLTNGFMHGFFPYVAYLIFGLAQARMDIGTGPETTAAPAAEAD